MALLILAALIWLGAHLGIAGTRLRGAIAARMGEGPFRGLFSALSIGAVLLLVVAYNQAPTTLLWVAPEWLRWLLVLAMLPAFFLFVASVTTPNPTAVGGRAMAPYGVLRITRHPMLWSFALWAAVHILGNGDTASLVFFGTFLITALAGMPSIDAKLAARDPAAWGQLAPTTSILPFGAIAAGRNHLALGEIGWIRPAIALLAWAAILHFHRAIFGVSPLPV